MNDHEWHSNEQARAAARRAGEWAAPREFTALVDLYCDAEATPEDARQLSGWLTRDADARRFFVAYLDLHARMQWEMRGVTLATLAGEAFDGLPVDFRLPGGSPEGTCALPGMLPPPLVPVPAPALDPPSRAKIFWRQSVEFLSSTTLFCLLASMVFTSLGLMALALWTVPRGPATHGTFAAGPPLPVHLAGSAGCRWLGAREPVIEVGSRLELAAGLAEIAFPSGARVLLEGPARFEVTGENSARIELGRLSARVPPEAVGFAVDTPGAQVIDLGTEFGVEVTSAGGSLLRVYAGKVEVQLRGAGTQRRTLAGGDVTGWSAAGEEHRAAEVSAGHFVRRLPVRLSPRVDLVEALLLGDGTALPRPAGLDPDTGAYLHEQPPRIARTGLGRYRPASGSAFVDGLFLLPSQAGVGAIDSTGRTAEFPRTAGVAHGIPWASRQWPIPASMLAGSVPFHEHRSEGGWLALPAGMGLSFDLNALRRASAADFERLRARGYRTADSRLDLWVLIDGVPCWKFDAVMSPVEDEPSDDAPRREWFEVLVQLEPGIRTLSVVAFEPPGAEGPSGVVLVDPHLEVREAD